MKQLGLHLIASLQTKQNTKLERFLETKVLIDEIIKNFDLKNLGEVYHDFSPMGFTALICLSESHISLHTWPELNKINLDIYLSNQDRVNDDVVRLIFEKFVNYFDAEVRSKTEMFR